jgi:hypothetical protein
MSLTTSDIHGCRIGTKRLGNFHSRERRQIREIANNTDIYGSNAGSLRKGPNTIRSINPLMPNYQFPGRTELINVNDAYGKQIPTKSHAQKLDNFI